ncbi:peroxiredoxin-like family protein [Marisediminicola senii]|uniref:peroxiredoxin-like family protein n=1 Tax=Marisediminicola senii TaxID=2711233 RepID=UPI0013EB9416|nr:peroxiredoxin-like family protein [Marisediminicola senii]
MSTSPSTIRESVTEFTVGFNDAVGPTLAAVFEREQAALAAVGVPSAVATAGQSLPAATLLAADGSQLPLADVLAATPAVIVFYRGAWCPYCNLTLKHYNENLAPALADRGVTLVAISPQTPEGTEAATLKDDLGFTVLSDPGNALANELGIVTAPSDDARAAHTELGFAVADSNADATPAIPYPTVLVVDAGGVIRWIDVHVDYTSRTEVPEVLAAVDAL